jgi:hypothetical protein
VQPPGAEIRHGERLADDAVFDQQVVDRDAGADDRQRQQVTRARGSSNSAASSVVIESGYMQIRWYQQSSQGTKWAISEKKRLPPVAIAATTKASHSS